MSHIPYQRTVITPKYPIYLSVFLFVLLLFSCFSKEKAQDSSKGIISLQKDLPGGSTLAMLRKRQYIRVGFFQVTPWAMQKKSGQWIGFEIDVAKKFSQDMGVELQLVPTQWKDLILKLEQDQFDIIIAGMAITKERAQKVRFSIPYEYDKTTILLKKTLSSLKKEDLNNPKYTFLGIEGTTHSLLSQELFPLAQFYFFADTKEIIQELVQNRAHAYITANVQATIYRSQYPESLVTPLWGKPLSKESIAFALPLNSENAWLKYIHQWIQTNWDNQFLEERAKYWFDDIQWIKEHQIDN